MLASLLPLPQCIPHIQKLLASSLSDCYLRNVCHSACTSKHFHVLGPFASQSFKSDLACLHLTAKDMGYGAQAEMS